MALRCIVLQPRRAVSLIVPFAMAATICFAWAGTRDYLARHFGFALGIVIAGTAIALVIAFNDSKTEAPPPPELPSFLAAVRAALRPRGYTVERCEGERHVFRDPRVLGNRFVVDVMTDRVSLAGASRDIDAVLQALVAYHRGDNVGPRSAYRGLISTS